MDIYTIQDIAQKDNNIYFQIANHHHTAIMMFTVHFFDIKNFPLYLQDIGQENFNIFEKFLFIRSLSRYTKFCEIYNKIKETFDVIFFNNFCQFVSLTYTEPIADILMRLSRYYKKLASSLEDLFNLLNQEQINTLSFMEAWKQSPENALKQIFLNRSIKVDITTGVVEKFF